MPIAYRQFAQTFLRVWAQEKIPVGQLITYMKTEKISYRRTDLLADYRRYARKLDIVDRYKYVPKKYRIPLDSIIPNHPFQTREYLYEGIVKIRVKATGEEFSVPGRASSDFRLTAGAADEALMDASREQFNLYGIETIGVEDVATFKKGALRF